MLQTRMKVKNAGSERPTLGVQYVVQNEILILRDGGNVNVARMGDCVTF